MQVNKRYNHIKKWGLILLKVLVSLLILFFLIDHFVNQKISLEEVFVNDFFFVVTVVLFLAIINWCLEAEKWRIAVPDENYTFNQSLVIVLSGLSLNWISPYTSGDLLLRVNQSKKRREATKASFLIRILSTIITLVYGGLSLIYYYSEFSFNHIGYILIVILVILFGYLLLTLSKNISSLALITLLRYAIFSFQLMLMIQIYVDVAFFDIIMGIGWIFLFKTFTPGIFGKMGVREASGILFFHGLIANSGIIAIPCFVIWVINNVIPTIIGAVLLNRTKLIVT